MKNNDFISPVILIGGNHHNTYGVLRALGKNGIRSFLILISSDTSKLYLQSSRYIKRNYVANNEDEVLEHLNDIKNKTPNKPIIICSSDEASHMLDSHFDELKGSFLFPNAEEKGRITSLMDKSNISELAKHCGLNVPKTWIISEKEIGIVDYPCIVKPFASYNSSKGDIHICFSRDELAGLLIDKTTYLYVQEYIERDFEFQLIGCSLNSGEEVIIPGYTKIIRSSDKTNTGVLSYQGIDFPLDLEKCKQLMKETKYSGLFSMEFIRDKKGDNYFLEINFRNDGNAISVTASGINLPLIWCLFNRGIDYNTEATKFPKTVKIMPLFDDYVYFVRTKKISLWLWLKEIMSIDCFMDFYFWDQIPFWRQVFHK